MIHKNIILGLLLVAAACRSASPGVAQIKNPYPPESHSHIAWVLQVMARMETIKPGMTRTDLLKVFTPEGGIIQDPPIYVSRDCPYFKVEVSFKQLSPAGRDPSGRFSLNEDGRDTIVRISKPYLGLLIID